MHGVRTIAAATILACLLAAVAAGNVRTELARKQAKKLRKQKEFSAEWEKINRRGHSKLSSHSLSRMMVL